MKHKKSNANITQFMVSRFLRAFRSSKRTNGWFTTPNQGFRTCQRVVQNPDLGVQNVAKGGLEPQFRGSERAKGWFTTPIQWFRTCQWVVQNSNLGVQNVPKGGLQPQFRGSERTKGWFRTSIVPVLNLFYNLFNPYKIVHSYRKLIGFVIFQFLVPIFKPQCYLKF